VPAIVARITYMARDMDGLRQEKRKRLEERLWLYHDDNVADYWETVEVEVRNKKGKVVLNADGTPKTKPITRMKDISQLTPTTTTAQARASGISLRTAFVGQRVPILAKLLTVDAGRLIALVLRVAFVSKLSFLSASNCFVLIFR
jgi:hypothetical protein